MFKRFRLQSRAMIRGIIQSRFLIVFISAFLCLNLSGSFCLAYCQIKDVKAEAEYCPLAKLDKENCPKSRNRSDLISPENSIGGDAVDCCLPAINFFAAKLEKNQFPVQTAVAETNDFSPVKPAAFEKIRYSSDFSYQTPLFDYRTARLKNCVFRI